MNKSLLVFITVFIASCSTYNVEREINKSTAGKYKNSAIIFRLPKSSPVARDELGKNFTNWLEGFKKNNRLLIIDSVNEKIKSYDSGFNRFYQVSDDNSFLPGKTIGSLSVFTKENETELKKVMAENSLDSVIIYEVDSFFSSTIQYMSFSSLIVIFDIDGRINYLDHQHDTFDTEEVSPFNSKIKMSLMDKVCERFIEQLLKLDYIEKN
jgi:hypothetical protein